MTTVRTKSAKVRGVVTSLFPPKHNGLFEDKVVDNTDSKRLIGFDSWQWKVNMTTKNQLCSKTVPL